jgi:transcriptional regulator with XRE-family HTH domain
MKIMKNPLQMKPEQCSALGREILKYMQDNKVSMRHLARLSGVTQPGIRSACFKGTSPTDSTLRKLAPILGKHPVELYYLAYEDRIGIPGQKETIIDILSRIYEEIKMSVVMAASDLAATIEKPSDNEAADIALHAIKSFRVDLGTKVASSQLPQTSETE